MPAPGKAVLRRRPGRPRGTEYKGNYMRREPRITAIIAAVFISVAGAHAAEGNFEAGEKFFSIFGSWVDKPGDAGGSTG